MFNLLAIILTLFVALVPTSGSAQTGQNPGVKLHIVDHLTGLPITANHGVRVLVRQVEKFGGSLSAWGVVGCSVSLPGRPCIGDDGVASLIIPNPGHLVMFTIQVAATEYVTWTDEFATTDDTYVRTVRLLRREFLLDADMDLIGPEGGTIAIRARVSPGVPDIRDTPLTLRATMNGTSTTGEQVVQPIGQPISAIWPANYGGTVQFQFAQFRVHQYVPSGSYFCVTLWLELTGYPMEPLASSMACSAKHSPLP